MRHGARAQGGHHARSQHRREPGPHRRGGGDPLCAGAELAHAGARHQHRMNELDLDETRGRNAFRVDLELSYGREKQDPRFGELWGRPTNTYTVDVNAYRPLRLQPPAVPRRLGVDPGRAAELPPPGRHGQQTCSMPISVGAARCSACSDSPSSTSSWACRCWSASASRSPEGTADPAPHAAADMGQ